MEMPDHHTDFGAASFLLPGLFLVGALAAYLLAAVRQRRSARSWNYWYTISFTGGIVMLAIAISPPLVHFAHHDVRGHMIQHLLIGMLAPLGLVLAAPVTLALRTLPIQVSRFITSLLRSRLFHWLSHPGAALIFNIGGMYLLYLTPLYALTLTNSYVHHLVHIHFLAAGYLFVWSIAGPDPAPRRPGMRIRLLVLFISMAAHACLSKLMYAYHLPQGTPHDVAQIKAAAQLMYYGGDLAELLLTVAFFAMWFRSRRVHWPQPRAATFLLLSSVTIHFSLLIQTPSFGYC